jgi:hypothetical protein
MVDESAFHVTMLLCHAAEIQSGMLFVLGGGWTECNPNTGPFVLAGKIEVPWDRANLKHNFTFELLDADGQPVTNAEDEPIVASGAFEVGRQAGLKPGTPLEMPFVIAFSPAELEPSSRYELRLFLAGKTRDHWRAGFSTRPAAA